MSNVTMFNVTGTSGSNGSPIYKHPKLEPRLSSSSVKSIKNVNMTPPPVLPPKTRKLQSGTGLQTAGQVVQTSERQVTTTNGAVGTGATSATGSSSGEHNITKRQHQLLLQQKGSNQETFVDDGVSVSVVRIGPGSGSGINRSVSSVGTIGSRARTRVPKPVRRSKSHLTGGGNSKYVTNITHGGSVTLVSLNNQDDVVREFQPIDPDITPR